MRLPRRVLLLVTLAGALFAAAAAHAAAPWSEPVALSSPSTFALDPRLAFDRVGTAHARWAWQDTTAGRSGQRAAPRPPGTAAFAAEHRLPTHLAPLAVYGRGRVATLHQRRATNRRRDSRLRLTVTFGSAGGRFGRPRTLTVYRPTGLPALDANARGDLAVAWLARPRRGRGRVWVRIRRAGQRQFGPRILLARPPRGGVARARRVTVAVGPRGHVLVAWEQGGRIHQRFARSTRGRFGPGQRLSTEESFNADFQGEVAADGRAILAWGSQFTSEGGDRGPARVQVAVKPAGSRRFGRGILLASSDPSLPVQAGSFALAVDPSGRALVAFDAPAGDRTHVTVASSGPNDDFADRQVLSGPEGGTTYDVASGPRGDAVVLWARRQANGVIGGDVLASQRPFGAAFGAPETVSAGGGSSQARVAFDPRTGLPTAVWVRQVEPPAAGPPSTRGRQRVEAARRGG